MDNYTLFLIKNESKNINISKVCNSLSWQDSIETLGMQLSVNIARNTKDKHILNVGIEVGDKIILKNNIEIFRGIITDVSIEKNQYSITAFDYAFYLNKSKTIIQFRKISAAEAIKKLCGQFNVPLGNITSMSTQINKIYKDKTIAEIIKDILNQATNELGKQYRLEMREGKLCIEEYKDLIVNATYQIAENLTSFNILDVIGSISKSESIQDMKNSIQVSSNDEKSNRIVANVKDEGSIKKYGLLQDVISVDKKDESQANNIAKNKLKELSNVSQNISIELLGNDNVRAGRILNITNDDFNMNGQYLVIDCTHNYNNSIHKMSLNVRKVI